MKASGHQGPQNKNVGHILRDHLQLDMHEVNLNSSERPGMLIDYPK